MSFADKQKNIAGKASLFVRAYLPCVVAFVVMLALIIVGSGMTKSANGQIASRRNDLIKIQNDTTSMQLSLKETVTVVDEPDHGFDTKRQQSDYQYFSSWIHDAFTWTGLTEYLAHRDKYVADLGPEHSFVRADGLMPLLESQPIIQRDYGSSVNPNEKMQCSIVDNPVQYVVAIDEETGVYSYASIIYVTGKDNMNNVRKSSVPIIMTYDIYPDTGDTSFRIRNFTASFAPGTNG